MKKIGILSDTHNWLDERIFTFFESCDEIWHAGDIGSTEVTDRLAAFKPLRAVYGNIDGHDLRLQFPKFLSFSCEQVQVLLTHIGGSPGRYDREAYQRILVDRPHLFVCGHSHILKVQFDAKLNVLCINPGAAGKHGFHQVRTMVRLDIDGTTFKNFELLEQKR